MTKHIYDVFANDVLIGSVLGETPEDAAYVVFQRFGSGYGHFYLMPRSTICPTSSGLSPTCDPSDGPSLAHPDFE